MSAAVWSQVRDDFAADRVGPIEVKGRQQPVEAYRILGTAPASRRRITPFVGRQKELTLLELLWSQSLTTGSAFVVSIIGDPGVGKSRLVSEVPPREGALDVRVRCESDRAYGPFLDLFEQILGGTPNDPIDLLHRTRELGVEDEVAVLVGTLLGLSGAPPVLAMADDQQKRQVFSGVWMFLTTILRDRPGLIVFDDLHWADRSSLELLSFLLERLGGLPLCMILSYRSGFDPMSRIVLRAGKIEVQLSLLTDEESVDLAMGYLGVRALPDRLERALVTRAEGNPFFIEELLEMLRELGLLVVADGQASLAGSDNTEVPDTVQGVILARIDRLKWDSRIVLQHAAVLGRVFTQDLLQSVVSDRDVVPPLDELSRAQLLIAQDAGVWSFKHAIIQEVTYETLLIRQRRELHRRVAETMENRLRGEPGRLEALAEHYALADIPEKAKAYALAAADAARDRMGFAEARTHYDRALKLWGDADPDGRAGVLMKVGWCALLTGDANGARTTLMEAQAAWRAVGKVRDEALALAMLGRSYFFTGESDRALEALKDAIRLLQADGPSPELIRAHIWRSVVDLVEGQIEEGTAEAEKGLRMAEELDLLEARAALEVSLGSFAVLGGDPAGVERLERGLELSRQANDVEDIGRAYLNLAIGFGELGWNARGIALCEEGRRALRKLGTPTFEWAVACKEAELLMAVGRYEDALDLSAEALGDYRPVLIRPALVWAGGARAWALVRRGRYDEAKPHIDDILPIARRIGGSMFAPIPLLVMAELERAQGNLVAARAAIVEGLDSVIGTTATANRCRLLPAVARLVPDRLGELLEGTSPVPEDTLFSARVAEAEGLSRGDPARLLDAADQYAKLQLPYEEAECAIQAGDLGRARRIVHEFGLEAGPLGGLLAQAEAAGETGRGPESDESAESEDPSGE